MSQKILIVEDDPVLLKLLRQNFRAAGFSVATAADGVQALQKARASGPDAILLDLVLPELDGFAVCEALRREKKTASIPILVVSGLSSDISRLAVEKYGANEHFCKPINPTDLIARIHDWLLKDASASGASATAPTRQPLAGKPAASQPTR